MMWRGHSCLPRRDSSRRFSVVASDTAQREGCLHPHTAHLGESDFRGFHPARNYTERTVEDLRTELRFDFAQALESCAVESKGGGSFSRAHLEQRILVIQQRRPAEYLAGAQRLHTHHVVGSAQLYRHASVNYQAEGRGALAISANVTSLASDERLSIWASERPATNSWLARMSCCAGVIYPTVRVKPRIMFFQVGKNPNWALSIAIRVPSRSAGGLAAGDRPPLIVAAATPRTLLLPWAIVDVDYGPYPHFARPGRQ
jgi:hypothetical protein